MKACKNCRYIFTDEIKCPLCGSEDVTDKFYGRIYILNTELSEIGKLIGAKTPGRYAVKINK